ncbi:hypothetical protein SAMN05216535_0083 [Stutzerimonas xanthomarina]|uniref:Uncharacterized protein n=2 Tax=Stutzerimonas xanthomarina TaxID=271420 RepID=A0A1M5L0R6_9GAMM|nr:hypothetical protein SAMN05216535_0083 [Stutzerimonas xanthomarina]SHG58674.1 hypothetical protein SAMN02744645_0785 [Stutzerimonas xanthomarina DSM 18231]
MRVGFVETVGLQFASVQYAYPAGHIGGLKPTLRAVRPDIFVGWAGRRSASAHPWDRRLGLAPSVSRPTR